VNATYYVYHKSDLYRFIVSPNKEILDTHVSYNSNSSWSEVDITTLPEKVLNNLEEQLCD